eukprot:316387-Prymnesium_polylepis.3
MRLSTSGMRPPSILVQSSGCSAKRAARCASLSSARVGPAEAAGCGRCTPQRWLRAWRGAEKLSVPWGASCCTSQIHASSGQPPIACATGQSGGSATNASG